MMTKYKKLLQIVAVIATLVIIAIAPAAWLYYGDNEALVIATIINSWATVGAVVVVVIGWRKSLELQRKANRDNAKIEAMKLYQNQLQERYEKMLEAIAPFISSMQMYSSLIGFSDEVSNAQLKTFFEGLHTDAKDMEKGVLPYYLTLQSNTFFHEEKVSIHARNIDRLSSEIRDILGHPLIPRSNGVTIQTFVTLNNLQNEFISEAYMFMRTISQAIKDEISS